MERITFEKTQATMFAEIKAFIPVENADLIKFIDYKIEQLENKASKPRKENAENAEFIEMIFSILENAEKALTIKEIQTANEKLAELSNQKVTALIKKLRTENRVKREIIKKVAYFSIGAENTVE